MADMIQPANQPGAAPKPPRRRGCLRVLMWFGLALLALVILWMSWAAYGRHRLSRRVQALTAEIQSERGQAAAADNAAPLYLQAFALYRPPPEEQSGIYKDIASPAHDYRPAAVAEHLAANRDYLAALRQAAAKPACIFPFDPSPGIAYWPAHLEGMRNAMRVLAVQARHEAQCGRQTAAMEALDTGLRLCRHAAGDPTLLSWICRNADESIFLGAARCVVEDAAIGEQDVTELLNQLAKYRPTRSRLGPALAADRLLGLVTVQRTIRGEIDFFRVIEEANGTPEGPAARDGQQSKSAAMIRWWVVSGLAARDARHYDEIMGRAISAAGRPFPQSFDELSAMDDEFNARSLGSTLVGGHLACRLLMPAIVFLGKSQARSCARFDAARLGLGCRLYRLKTGAYPETLAELSAKLPGHFKEPPADPFTGKPFLYKRTATGCLVWSVGADRADDGGDPKKDVIFELKK